MWLHKVAKDRCSPSLAASYKHTSNFFNVKMPVLPYVHAKVGHCLTVLQSY